MFVVQSNGPKNPSLLGKKGLPRLGTTMVDTLVACMAIGDVLISIEKQKVPLSRRVIREYPIEFNQSGLFTIGKSSKDLGSTDHSVDEKAHIAAMVDKEGRRLLILCTSNGDISRYVQQDSRIN